MMGRTRRCYPNAIELEKAVLGAILIDERVLDEVADLLAPEAFYREANRRLFQLFLDLRRNGRSIDLASVVQELLARDATDQVGGIAAVSALPDATSGTWKARAHAREIVDKYRRRQVLHAMGQLTEAIMDNREAGIVQELGAQIAVLARPVREEEDIFALSRAISLQERRFLEVEKGIEEERIPTGLPSLDRRLGGGLRLGELWVLAGRPGMGKTAAGLEILLHTAIRRGIPSYFQSIEMAVVLNGHRREDKGPVQMGQLMPRALASWSRIDSQRIRAWSGLTDQEKFRVVQAMEALSVETLVIDQTGRVNITRLRQRIAREVETRGVKLVVVDFLQRVGGSREDLRLRERVSEVAEEMANLAREHRIVLLVLAQINRSVASRESKRPEISDLKESGAIEENARGILLLHRPAYYLSEKQRQELSLEAQREALWIVGKNSDGWTGDVTLQFRAEWTRFYDLDGVHEPDLQNESELIAGQGEVSEIFPGFWQPGGRPVGF